MGYRESRHANVRATILQRAIELVEKSGVAEFSARKLANAIEYSPAVLYEYFDGKDALLGEVIVFGQGLLADYMKRAREGATPENRVLRLGLEYLNFAREHSNLYHLMFELNTSVRRTVETQVPPDSAYGLLMEQLSEFHPSGPVENLAYGYWSLVHGMASLELNHLKDFDADFRAAQELGIHCFLKGVAAR